MCSLSNWFNEFPMKLLKAGRRSVSAPRRARVRGFAERHRVELTAAWRVNGQLPLRIITRLENFSQQPHIWDSYSFQKCTRNRTIRGENKRTTFSHLDVFKETSHKYTYSEVCTSGGFILPVKSFRSRKRRSGVSFCLFVCFLSGDIFFFLFFYLNQTSMPTRELTCRLHLQVDRVFSLIQET